MVFLKTSTSIVLILSRNTYLKQNKKITISKSKKEDRLVLSWQTLSPSHTSSPDRLYRCTCISRNHTCWWGRKKVCTVVYTLNIEKDLGNNVITQERIITSQSSTQNTQKIFERCNFHKGMRFQFGGTQKAASKWLHGRTNPIKEVKYVR